MTFIKDRTCKHPATANTCSATATGYATFACLQQTSCIRDPLQYFCPKTKGTRARQNRNGEVLWNPIHQTTSVHRLFAVNVGKNQ
jgi:hypothetical protein